MEVRGSVAILTGATGGLGGCIGQTLAAAGAHVVGVYLNSTQLAKQRAEEWSEFGQQAIPVQADVTTAEGAATMVKAALDAFGKVDILVNNAAFNQWVTYSDLDAMTEDLWTTILSSNLTGPFLCTKAVAPVMREQQRGRIINIASIAGVQPGGSSIAYAVSKAGLIHLTRCMAVALAPHVLVNCVAPGLLEGTRATERLDPEFIRRGREAAALKRIPTKEDVADQIMTFVRTDSTTGQTVLIDAGRVYH